jgi:hypothetical protein
LKLSAKTGYAQEIRRLESEKVVFMKHNMHDNFASNRELKHIWQYLIPYQIRLLPYGLILKSAQGILCPDYNRKTSGSSRFRERLLMLANATLVDLLASIRIRDWRTNVLLLVHLEAGCLTHSPEYPL